jgi:hypothetical protein
MPARRTVPTVFSIYMLDVICCALGCVILLWQVSYQEADEQTAAAKDAEQRWRRAALAVESVTGEAVTLKQALEQAIEKHHLLTADLTQARDERDAARKLVALREQDYEKLSQAMRLSESLLKNVRGELEKTKGEQKATAAELAGKVKANAELLLQVSAAAKKVGTLEKEVAARKLDAAEAAKRLEDQLARLARAEKTNKTLESQLAGLKTEGKEAVTKLSLNELRIKVLEQELDRYKKELKDGGERAKDLQLAHDRMSKQLAVGATNLAAAQKAVAVLEGEKTALLTRTQDIQAEAERRFAGIALTGRRVIFLVDMSGSMELIDAKTLDPDKWPLVCETVARIMQSIAGLQQYQVILFSDRVRYPLGKTGEWLTYDPTTTPRTLLAQLRATRPEGETNMEAAFAEAFRYRDAGLDTIYVLSDGLPTAGTGLPAGGPNLTDNERTDLLARHLRGKLKTDWNRRLSGRERVRINTIGFFFESPDVGAFLWALAREHDGSFVGMSR